MRMWTVKIIILLLFCYAFLSTESQNVRFVSKNFFNILQWDPAPPTPSGQNVLYSVWYKSDIGKETYEMIKECQNITALSCNLTDQTPSLYDVHYNAKVLLSDHSRYGHTIRFTPMKHTIFGPPSLSTYTTVSSLHVNVTLPFGPNRTSIKDIIINSSKGYSKPVFSYYLTITHPKWGNHTYPYSTTGLFIIDLKKDQTEYCGYVYYRPSVEWGRPRSETATFCAKLQGEPLKTLPWLLVGAALLVVIVIISVVLMFCYVRGGTEAKKMPELLETVFNSEPKILKFGDGNLVISKPEFDTSPGEKTVYATIQVKPNQPKVGPGGYSPQDILWQDSVESSVSSGVSSRTSDPVDTSRQSSEIYSVVAVHVPAEENGDDQQDTTRDENFPLLSSGGRVVENRMSPELNTCGVQPLPALDPYESKATKPLVLDAVRGPNGQLMLPSLALQLQNDTAERERKPLLSDIINCSNKGPSLASLGSFDSSEWSDSGCDDSTVNTPTHPYCNTNYSPSQPVVSYLQQSAPSHDAISETGYKENWMPAVLQGISSKDSCGYLRTNSQVTWSSSITEEEEDEEKDEEGREDGSREILLGGWGLKIQE